MIARRRRFQPLLDRATARGEHPPSVAELEDLLLAPLYFHALFAVPLRPDDTQRLVARLLAAGGHSSTGGPSTADSVDVSGLSAAR